MRAYQETLVRSSTAPEHEQRVVQRITICSRFRQHRHAEHALDGPSQCRGSMMCEYRMPSASNDFSELPATDSERFF